MRIFDSPGYELPRPDLAVPVIYEDDDAILFDKPAGMPCHVSKGHPDDTLANFYAAHCPGSKFRVLGRLDKDTSGLVLATKNARAAQFLTDSRIFKEYAAILCGVPDKSGCIDAPIEDRDPGLRRRYVSDGGRPSITRYRVICSSGGRSLVSACPETGRTHQIRVHFSYADAPLAGDALYGGDCEAIGRQALHRRMLRFIHPVTGETMSFSSDIPADMLSAAEYYRLSVNLK